MGDTWEDCKAKLYFFLRGIQPLDEPDYFVSGRAWTDALTAWYMTKGTHQEKLDAARVAMIKVYGASQTVIFAPERTLDNLLDLFDLYIMEFPTEGWKMVAGEIGWLWPLSDFYLGGAMDAYIQWDPYGPLVFETKTTLGYVTEQTTLQYQLNLQVTQYHWGLAQHLVEEVWGVLMNLAYLKILQKAKVAKQFMRWIEQRSPNQLKMFEENWKARVAAIRAMWKTPKCTPATYYNPWGWTPPKPKVQPTSAIYPEWSWPQDGRFCGGGYGLKPCPYFHLCAQGLSATEVHIPSNIYTYRPKWKPWERSQDGNT
jgi:hypothetical protein